jgi:hypothetical protein
MDLFSVHDKKYSVSFRTRVTTAGKQEVGQRLEQLPRNLKPLLLRFLPLVEMTKIQPMQCLLIFCRARRDLLQK